MFSRIATISMALCLTAGCVSPDPTSSSPDQAASSLPRFISRRFERNSAARNLPPEQVTAPFQRFVAQNFDWTSVQRVVLMPLSNQTAYSRVGDELFSNLAAELQKAGRFDVVTATNEDPAARARDIFRSGEFNEIELLRIAREYGAQAVVFANVTQYQPYSPPRVGLSLLVVSPAEGIAIASIDGLWDAREKETARLAHAQFNRTKMWPKSLIDTDRAIESPEVFQRFVCEQIASSLIPSAGFPATLPAGGAMPGPALPAGVIQGGVMPGGMAPDGSVPGAFMPSGQISPEMGEIPPVPPSSMSIP